MLDNNSCVFRVVAETNAAPPRRLFSLCAADTNEFFARTTSPRKINRRTSDQYMTSSMAFTSPCFAGKAAAAHIRATPPVSSAIVFRGSCGSTSRGGDGGNGSFRIATATHRRAALFAFVSAPVVSLTSAVLGAPVSSSPPTESIITLRENLKEMDALIEESGEPDEPRFVRSERLKTERRDLVQEEENDAKKKK